MLQIAQSACNPFEYLCSVSDEYRGMQASSSYPLVMKYLPVLLPRQFDALLSSASSENVDSLLAKLEDIIENDVWKLGFSEVSASLNIMTQPYV
jgi:hypothetical protein